METINTLAFMKQSYRRQYLIVIILPNIESLMFLMNYIRQDIGYAINRLSRYSDNLNHDLWNAIVIS